MDVTATSEPIPLASSRRARPADVQAVAELFERYENDLGRFLVQLVASRPLAEDLLQETFEDALRARDQLAAVDNPRAWLYAVARNRALGSFRREGRYRRALSRLVAPALGTAGESAEVAAVRDLLERVLSQEDRALMLLRYGHGFTSRELGDMTGASAEAVRQRLSRARARVLEAAETEGTAETR